MIYVFVTSTQYHGLCICNKVNVMVYVFVTRIQCHGLCICDKHSMSWFMYL